MLEPLSRDIMLALLQQLAVAFPRRAGEDATALAKVYYESLKHFPADAVRYAVRKSIETEDRFPRVVQLREMAGRWQQANNASATAKAEDTGDGLSCPVCGAQAELSPKGRLCITHDRAAHHVS